MDLTVGTFYEALYALKEADLFAKYPGIDRILTPEKITAYDRGEYDDLDALCPELLPGMGRTGSIVIAHCSAAVMKSSTRRGSDSNKWAARRCRIYEAELISRYKAGLL